MPGFDDFTVNCFVYRMKDIFYICSLLFALAACLL